MSVPVTRVGKYHIVEQIGEGAMGVVYKATDPVLNRTVAIKIMSEGMAHDEALRARFLREAQAAGSLQHPNVVTIYDFGETDGHLFIAMEYIQGADLEHLLKHNAPLSLAAKLDIIIDVLNGLSYAHRRGIVHRDIKPANIRVDDEGHARIMDFGVAHLGTSNLTGTGVMMGTPNYMAPEQISGEGVTPAVDLFSAGAMLYELLTHEKPFQGDTLHSVLFKIVSDTPPDVGELKPDLPSALNAIVSKALEKDPADRYKSAAEMANAISAVRVPLGPARISKTVSQRISIDRGLQAQREAVMHARVIHRRRVAAASAAALLGLAVITTVALRSRNRGSASQPPAAQVASTAAPSARTPSDTVPAPSAVADTSARVAPNTAVVTPSSAGAPNPPPASSQRPLPEAARRVSAPPAPQQSRPIVARAPDTTTRRARPEDTARAVTTAPSTPAPQGATTSSQTPPVVTPPVAPPPAAVPPAVSKPAEPENPTAAIGLVIAAYARSIGTRDIAEVRRVYAGITSQQQSQLESFFASVRSLTATLQIASLDVNGATATARVSGLYEYVGRNGRAERTPVAFDATLVRDGDRWKLQTVR